MADYRIFENKEFDCLTKRQKELLVEMSEMIKNGTSSENAAMIMRFVPMLEKEGTLTPQQKRAMALCILSNMSDEERNRCLTVFRFAGII